MIDFEWQVKVVPVQTFVKENMIKSYQEENTKLKTDCNTLVQKLLQVKPELREWLEVNYGEYL